jgi:hypothetical protein
MHLLYLYNYKQAYKVNPEPIRLSFKTKKLKIKGKLTLK